jgi:putative N6-adenine-specific DNA methylase
MLRLAATCGLGLEELLAAELRALGAGAVMPERGAVSFAGEWELVYRANLWLRTANRVLVELGAFSGHDDEALYAGARNLVRRRGGREDRLDLAKLLSPSRTLVVDATTSASRITDSRWVALKTKDGIVDGQRDVHGQRSTVDRDDADLRLRLRLSRDQATLYLDSSGEPLDHRGYRLQTVQAPVREQLAAAMVLASGWDGKGVVVDPMCGSGTLLIEAASWALGRSPQVLRQSFLFERFWGFDRALFARLREAAALAPETEGGPRLYGVDRDPGALAAAGKNLEAASLDEDAFLKRADAFEWTPPAGPGLLLVNPPYGERLGLADELWPRLGDLMKKRYQGFVAAVLAGGEDLGKSIGLKPRRRWPVKNGPLDARILVFDLY